MQLESHSKVDIVHQSIENRILAGEWAIGDQIPTESEMAVEFNCSRGTVSKAIERLAHDGLVLRKTRDGTRVLKCSLNESKELVQFDACAFIYPNEQHEGIWRIVQGFQQSASEAGRRMVTLTTGTDFRKESEIVGRLGEFDVKGAVVYPVLPDPKDRLYFAQMLMACRFPVVLADITLPGFGAPSVMIDGYHAGYTMTRHLLAGGLRKIGFATNYSWAPSFQERYRGYCWAMEEAGIDVEPGWAFLEPSLTPDFRRPVERSLMLAKSIMEKARDLEGIVAGNDFIALSCLEVARELGLRVPEDLKVVGIDDFAISAQSDPSLTTYHVPYEDIGRQSFEMLNSLLQSKKISTTELLVRGSLVVRKSG